MQAACNSRCVRASVCVCVHACADATWWTEKGVYLATVLLLPSGVNAGVGVQQFLNERKKQTDGQRVT